MSPPLTILVLGAHPDDAEFHMGGTLSRYCRDGHRVKVISVTDGSSGHHEMSGPALTERRTAELAASTGVIGAQSEVWPFPDGRLQATLDVRERVIAEIRRLAPDLVFTHRPNDYHPDHRAVGQAVQDASYLVTVPPIVPEVPALRRDPVVAYMNDNFTRPYPFEPDIIVDVTAEMDAIVEMGHCHTSQSYEWLPYNHRVSAPVPDANDPAARKAWLRPWLEERWTKVTDRHRDRIPAGSDTTLIEAFEISEYAADMSKEERARLFPFAL